MNILVVSWKKSVNGFRKQERFAEMKILHNNMKKKNITHSIANVLVLAIFCILLILPARFYIDFSIAKDVQANIVVNYLNFVEFLTLCLAIFCVIIQKKAVLKRKYIYMLGYVWIVMIIYAIALVISGNVIYFSELIAKLIVLISSVFIAEYIDQKFDINMKMLTFIIPLLILVIASFFLTGYGSYGTSNRAGTIGFGSNEAAMFACILIAIALVINANMFVKAGFLILGISCVFVVSSRRGIVVAIGIIGIYSLLSLIKRKDKIKIGHLVAITALAGIMVFVFYKYYDVIYNNIINSPLVIRFKYTERMGQSIFDTSDRATLYQNGIRHLIEHPFLGYMGSDKLYAQGEISHAHNLILQFLVVYGVVLGSVIAIYFVCVFLRAIRILITNYHNKNLSSFDSIVSLFFVIYFAFDMLGYLLWNPKGMLWVLVSTHLINNAYRNRRVVKV